MRITPLVIFILCFTLASSIIGTLNLFETIPTDSNTQKLMQEIDSGVNNQSYLGSSVQSGGVLTQVGDFITGLYTFVKIFFVSLILPSSMLQNYGVPAQIANWIAYPIYFLYIVAIVQMISGRYVE